MQGPCSPLRACARQRGSARPAAAGRAALRWQAVHGERAADGLRTAAGKSRAGRRSTRGSRAHSAMVEGVEGEEDEEEDGEEGTTTASTATGCGEGDAAPAGRSAAVVAGVATCPSQTLTLDTAAFQDATSRAAKRATSASLCLQRAPQVRPTPVRFNAVSRSASL
mmetsp:Transcript_74855/g.242020  ORF Transcript_74855/g.242020 Transcript_74855/m.242020 type:complete len:166 (-) Transcript_74855:199-696(-)